MNELRLLDWNQPERKVRFVGYNDLRTVCYIYNEEPARRAIDLWMPSGYGLKFVENPMPATPPDEICRTVLSLPSFGPFIPKGEVACYHLLKSQDTSTPPRDPVRLESLHPRCLDKWDAPDLDEKLLNALADELQRRRDERAAIERQIATLPDDKAETARIHCLPFPKEIASDEATTPEELKQNKLGLRAKVLQQEFIEHHGLDPEKIGSDYLDFCRWIRLGAKRLDDETLARLADRIRYRIHFEDNTARWLESVHERALTTQQEHDDFDRLESVSKAPLTDSAATATLQSVVPQLGAVATRLENVRDDLKPLTQLYSNPAFAAVRRVAHEDHSVPELFIDYVIGEFQSRRFPTTDEATRYLQNRKLGRELANKDGIPPARATIGRWLKILGDQLEKKGLKPERGTGRSRRPASLPDHNIVEDINAPDPADEALNRISAEEKASESGDTTTDSRSRELPDDDSSEGDPS